jgi:hypothetical protein
MVPLIDYAPLIPSVILRHARTKPLHANTVSHLHEALIPSAWSQDVPPPYGMYPVEVTLHHNASEPSILPSFQALAVSEADPLAHFESGAYSRKA